MVSIGSADGKEARPSANSYAAAVQRRRQYFRDREFWKETLLVPVRRKLRRVYDPAAWSFQIADRRHFVARQGEIENVRVLGQAFGFFRSREREHIWLLDQPAQYDLCDVAPMLGGYVLEKWCLKDAAHRHAAIGHQAGPA